VKTILTTNSRLTIEEVWELYREDLKRVEEQIHTDLKSNIPLIDTISTYLFNSGGKAFSGPCC